MSRTGRKLAEFPIHLGLGAAAEAQPAFPPDERAMDWYAEYEQRHAADGEEGRLVSSFTFAESWTSWEMHPAGAEVVICTAGALTLVQEIDGEEFRTSLVAGQYAINPAGVWHTADVNEEATCLFITPGAGTQHRPR